MIPESEKWLAVRREQGDSHLRNERFITNLLNKGYITAVDKLTTDFMLDYYNQVYSKPYQPGDEHKYVDLPVITINGINTKIRLRRLGINVQLEGDESFANELVACGFKQVCSYNQREHIMSDFGFFAMGWDEEHQRSWSEDFYVNGFKPSVIDLYVPEKTIPIDEFNNEDIIEKIYSSMRYGHRTSHSRQAWLDLLNHNRELPCNIRAAINDGHKWYMYDQCTDGDRVQPGEFVHDLKVM